MMILAPAFDGRLQQGAALKKARVMLASGDYTRAEVAADLHVSRHTLWRELARAAAE